MKAKVLIFLLALAGLLPLAAQAQLTYTTNNGAITITGYNGSPTNIVIPAYTNGYPVTSIGNDSLYYISSLTSITIPDSVTNIGEMAFVYCSSLTSVVIGNGVTSIGYQAFEDCTSLASITIPNSVTIIGNSAFAYCPSLASVVIGNGVTSIGNDAFYLCRSLTNVFIGSGVTSIGQYAFFCTSLTSITISNNVTSMSSDAFANCASLTNISVVSGNRAYSSTNGVLFNSNKTVLIEFPTGLGGSYTIPNGVKSIGYEAFVYCTNLTSITIPNSVTIIGDLAFGEVDYSSLTNVTFLGNAPSLGGDYVFFGNYAPVVYYYYGTSGWGTTYGGLTTVMLAAPAPQIEGGSNVGVQYGNFSFTITGVTNQTAVIEASTNLMDWQPVWTNMLSGASATFTDLQWTNYPARYYRAR